MDIDRKLIEKVSRLARLELTDGEKEEFTQQLSDIIGYVEKINELDTGNVMPAEHIVDLKNVFRQPDATTEIERADLEASAPCFKHGHIVVPKIIESE